MTSLPSTLPSALPAARPTLAGTVWPRPAARPAALGRDAFLVLTFSLLTALCAQVTIPLPYVPITGQTFAVLLAGALLGPRLGALAMLAYLGEGLAGLPVFALAHSAWTPGSPLLPGVPTIVGLSAGFLWSYPFAAALVGGLAERGWDRKPATTLAAMLLGSLVIFACGAAWLGHYVGASRALPLGVWPFLPGDAVKALLAAGLLPLGWKILGGKAQGKCVRAP